MGNPPLDWKSFWDIASPKQAAQALVGFYGPSASEAAVHCALAAEADGRDEDRRFWQAVKAELVSSSGEGSEDPAHRN